MYRQPSPHPHYQNGGYNPPGPSPSASYRQPSPAANYQNPQQTVSYPHQTYPVQQQQQPSQSSNYPQPSYQQQSQPSAYQQPAQQRGYQQSSYQQPGYQPSSGGHKQPSQQQTSQQQQLDYQRQISEKSQYPSVQHFSNPDRTFMRQTTPSYLPAQQSAKPPSCTAAFTGGVSVGNKALAQSQSEAQPTSNWSHVQPSRPVHTGYVQPQYNQQSSQPSYLGESANVVNQNKYQPQQTYHQQQQQQQPQYQQHQQQQQQQQQQQYQPCSVQQPSAQQHQLSAIYSWHSVKRLNNR